MNMLGLERIEKGHDIRMMERRWHQRIEVDVPAVLILNGCPTHQPCRILDYSMGRLFIETWVIKCRHQFVMIHIRRWDGSIKAVRGMAIHLTEDGAGLEAEERFWARDCNLGQSSPRPGKPCTSTESARGAVAFPSRREGQSLLPGELRQIRPLKAVS